MGPAAKLPPQTIAGRQMLVAGLVSFILGFVGVLVGVLWMEYALDPDRFWSWDLIMRVLQALHLGVFGGLCLCAAVCCPLNWCDFRKGCFPCHYCCRLMPGMGQLCVCLEVMA